MAELAAVDVAGATWNMCTMRKGGRSTNVGEEGYPVSSEKKKLEDFLS